MFVETNSGPLYDPGHMRVLAALALVGCASGRASLDPPDADTSVPTPDAAAMVDARVSPPDAPKMIDATTVVPPDAFVPPPPDAYVCQVMTRQLLINPVLDLNPSGMGWIQQNIDNAFPIVTSDGFTAHSAPYKAWMGGFSGQDKGVASVTDTLYQDVTVPMGTTQLVFTAQYVVGTTETGTTVYDTAQVGLTQTNGTPIQTIQTFSNAAPVGAWTAINYTVPQNLSGQTVRLRFTTTNDITNHTNFFFDTIALTATYCQ